MRREALSFVCIGLGALFCAAILSACAIDKRGRAWDTSFDASVCGTRACDDSIPCTVDDCTPSGCVSTPNHAACSTYPDGVCDPSVGCVYPCTSISCFPILSCQTATCVNERCVRTPETCP
ncbi:MAG: hypothetical protein IPK60_17860 [Sandaracinaceae bacterium]|nr:hypothetical protein [Sandaracinaceae bacterium]